MRFMKELLYGIVELLAKIHSYLLRFNDAYEYNFSDKELHFLVIGILGMMFIFVVYPVFKWLAKHDHVMVIAWIYVFTLIIVITFAIEIGQKVTNTGNMEFADIVFGVVGFIVMFFIFAVIREIYIEFSNYGGAPIRVSFNDSGAQIAPAHREFIDEGIALLREKSPWELVRISHAKGSPWDEVYNVRNEHKGIIPNEMILAAATGPHHGR